MIIVIVVLTLQTVFLRISAFKLHHFSCSRINKQSPLSPTFNNIVIHHHSYGKRATNSYHFNLKKTSLSSTSSDADMNWDPRAAPKLDFNEDYYIVLEVSPDVNAQDLKKAYYRLVFDYHPDRKKTEEAKSLCNKQMMVINNAYKVLKEPKSKSEYDIQRRMRTGSTSSSSNNVSGSSSGSSSSTTSTDKSSQKSTSSTGSGRAGPDFSSFNQGAFKWRDKTAMNDVFNSIFEEDDEDDLYSEAEDYFRDPRDDPAFRNQFKSTTSRPMDANSRINAVRQEKEAKMDALASDRRDWGEVTDARAIKKRLKDLEEVRRLDELLIELQAEQDYQNWVNKQGRMSGSTSSSSRFSTDRDSMGAQPRTSSLWDDLIGVSDDKSSDPFRETFRDGKSSGKEYDSDGVPLWRKAQAEQRRGRGTESVAPPPRTAEMDINDAIREELDRLFGKSDKKSLDN